MILVVVTPVVGSVTEVVVTSEIFDVVDDVGSGVGAGVEEEANVGAGVVITWVLV